MNTGLIFYITFEKTTSRVNLVTLLWKTEGHALCLLRIDLQLYLVLDFIGNFIARNECKVSISAWQRIVNCVSNAYYVRDYFCRQNRSNPLMKSICCEFTISNKMLAWLQNHVIDFINPFYYENRSSYNVFSPHRLYKKVKLVNSTSR